MLIKGKGDCLNVMYFFRSRDCRLWPIEQHENTYKNRYVNPTGERYNMSKVILKLRQSTYICCDLVQQRNEMLFQWQMEKSYPLPLLVTLPYSLSTLCS